MQNFGTEFVYMTLPILIDRDNQRARELATDLIIERAHQIFDQETPNNGIETWSQQICIFAEGTTTNRRDMINFRPGDQILYIG